MVYRTLLRVVSRALVLPIFLCLCLAACSRTDTPVGTPKPEDGPSVGGTWAGQASSEYVTLPLRLELQQTGSALTGTVTMVDAPAPELNVTGQVAAPNVNFSFTYDLGSVGGGANVVARYAFSGAVTGGTMAGNFTVSVDGAGAPVPGTFSFQKQP